MKAPFASVAAALLVTGLVAGAAHALVRIGVPADMSGPNSDYTGPGSVEAARMATEDFGGKVLGRPTEVMSADHQKIFTSSFVWNRTPETRAWAERLFARREAVPSETQVGVYSSVLHYLKSVQAAGTLASDQVIAEQDAFRPLWRTACPRLQR